MGDVTVKLNLKGINELMKSPEIQAALQKAGLQMESARVILGVPEDDTFANFKRPTESHGPIDHFFVRGLKPVAYWMITDTYGCTKMSAHYPILLDIAK